MLVSEAIYKNLKPVFSSRIWPNAAPEDAEYPLMIYTETNSDALNTIDMGFLGHSKNRVQMWVFAKEYAEVKKLKDQIISIMAGQTDLDSCNYIGNQYQFEEQTQSHLIVIEFSMWEQTT